jgi:hypothetical protein
MKASLGEEATRSAEPVFGASTGLRILSKRCQIHVVSARNDVRLQWARQWLVDRGLMRFVHGVHSSDGTTKWEVCANLGCSVLVDDDLRHFSVCRDRHEQILFRPDGPQEPFAPAIRTVRSWSELSEVLLEYPYEGSAPGRAP